MQIIKSNAICAPCPTNLGPWFIDLANSEGIGNASSSIQRRFAVVYS